MQVAAESLMICADFHGKNDNVLVYQILDQDMGHFQLADIITCISNQIHHNAVRYIIN
jgi:hypothetical protein